MFKILKQYKTSILAGLLEIVIVFVGISISLYIDDWREENDDREKEAIYLEELYYDVTYDMMALNNKINQVSSARYRLQVISTYTHFPDSIALSQVDFKNGMSKALKLETFVSRDYTFNDLTSTGNIKLIQDKKIRKLIYSYYGRVKQLIDVEEINNKATSEILTNDLMQIFPLRQIFHYNGVYDGLEEITYLDMTFLKDVNSPEFIHLENAILLRLSLLSIESRSIFKVSSEAITLRKLLGDFLNLPDEEEFVREVIKRNVKPVQLLEEYRKDFPEFTVLETPLNEMTYTILEKHPVTALDLFKMNAELYPDSPNVFDSLGDGYLANGDKKKALENFRKAFEMDPFLMETKQKIDKLKNNNL